MNKIPKIAAIHDMSGVGRCSLTVILPILSALGCQVCPLPTALLSHHSEYDEFYFRDLTDSMEEYYRFWEKNGEEFDCVYTGFIGSENQIDIIIDIIKRVKEKNDSLIVVDPVMGDHGFTYKTYNSIMIEKMTRLVEKADIITPNMTEASILLGYDKFPDTIDTGIIKSCLKGLSDIGPDIAVITGITMSSGEYINACYDKKSGTYWKVPFNYIGARYPGTGDLFTSLFVGYLFRGKSVPQAIEEAARFVSLSVKVTNEEKTPSREGVIFEKIMKELYTDTFEYRFETI
jgi:pyridoxine kinase